MQGFYKRTILGLMKKFYNVLLVLGLIIITISGITRFFNLIERDTMSSLFDFGIILVVIACASQYKFK